jgi:hypothetical protein
MVTAVERGEDGLEPANHRARLAVFVSLRVRFADRVDVAAPDGGRANAVLKRSHYWITSGLH